MDYNIQYINDITNFGHKIILHLNDSVNILDKDDNIYVNSYNFQSTKEKKNIYEIDKYELNKWDIFLKRNLNNIKYIKNQKKYLKLERIIITIGMNSNWSYDDTQIMFVNSLFVKPEYLLNIESFKEFIYKSKYYTILVYYISTCFFWFPKSNHRIYIDKYLLDFLEKQKDDNRFFLDNFGKRYIEIGETNYNTKYNDKYILYIKEFIKLMKDLNKNIICRNLKERFLLIFQLASCIYYNKISNRQIEIFTYKFEKPFIENIGSMYEAHVNKGYIGQVVRFFPMFQTDYNNIRRPKYLVFRDAHNTFPMYIDYLWICIHYKYSKIYNNHNYLIYYQPYIELEYGCDHHNIYYNKVTKQKHSGGIIAGLINMVNFTQTKYWLSSKIYKLSYGKIFTIHKNKLLFLNIRKNLYSYAKNDILKDYMYGIDEYPTTFYFTNKFYYSRSIYVRCLIHYEFNFHSFDIIDKNKNIYSIHKGGLLLPRDYLLSYFTNKYLKNRYNKCFIILIFYFLKIKIYHEIDIINIYDFIREVEKLRSSDLLPSTDTEASYQYLKNFDALNLVLSILPNQYFFYLTNFAANAYLFKWLFYKIEDIIYALNKNILPNILNLYKNLSLENLNKLNLVKYNSIINSPIKYDLRPYLLKLDNKIDNSNYRYPFYYSGFYKLNKIEPKLGYLNQPRDLKKLLKNLIKLKIDKNILQKSLYQIKINN